MKQMLLSRTLLMVLAVTCLCAGTVHAHGTGFQLMPDRAVFTVRFFYTGGQPMAYAKVNIQGPDSDKPEHQNGRTDCKGLFAFCPDQSGTWVLTVNDGRGHRVRAKIEVADNDHQKPAHADAVQTDSAKSPGWVQILAGLSILLNIALIPGALRKRK